MNRAGARSRLAVLFFVKISMCSYEKKPSCPVTEREISVTLGRTGRGEGDGGGGGGWGNHQISCSFVAENQLFWHHSLFFVSVFFINLQKFTNMWGMLGHPPLYNIVILFLYFSNWRRLVRPEPWFTWSRVLDGYNYHLNYLIRKL